MRKLSLSPLDFVESWNEENFQLFHIFFAVLMMNKNKLLDLLFINEHVVMKMEFFEALLIVMKIKECLIQNDGFYNVYLYIGNCEMERKHIIIFVSISQKREESRGWKVKKVFPE